MDFHHALRGALLSGAISALALAGTGCADPPETPSLKGQVHLTLIHSSDIHSRLFPYNLQLGQVDAGLGLGSSGSIVNVGGAARVSHIIGRERARSDRVLHLDGGDCFQGAPIFNFFSGEAEVRAVSAMGTDAMIVANHEFDRGALNLGIQLQNWADFPVLAANYQLEDPSQPGASPLGSILKPYTVFDLQGLKVGVIGMGNLSSMTSIFDRPNRLGITPLNTVEVAQFYVDLLRPHVDVLVMVTHLGLDVDERMIARTSGIDVVLGGHNHIVLQPPKRVADCQFSEPRADGSTRHFIALDGPEASDKSLGCQSDADCAAGESCFAPDTNSTPACKIKRDCNPREVILAHSGAFAKYVGRLDVVVSNDKTDLRAGYDPLDGFEVVNHNFELFPVTETTPEDPIVSSVLEPYHQGLDALANLELLVGYALDGSKRNSTSGGDSALGNLIATAMWLRLGIQTDFSLTNSTGIRTDLVPGPVTVEQMYNIFPFDNSITKMNLSGVEVQDLFDFVARRSSGRGCVSQVQIAGARIVIDCTKLDTYTPTKCETDAECSADQNPLGVTQTCNPATKACACTDDASCPGDNKGQCSVSTGLCAKSLSLGKATHVYIGTYPKDKACLADKDCPDQAQGQCDVESGVCWQPINPIASYELATSNYLAQGGSGFRVLQRNTTQNDTKVQQRDALIDYIRAGYACGTDLSVTSVECKADAQCPAQHLCDAAAGHCDPRFSCATDAECGAAGEGFVCACPEAVVEGEFCSTKPGATCGAGRGLCVLAKCRDDVATFQRKTCEAAPNETIRQQCITSLGPCASGGEQCKFLACVDRKLGSFSDGRIKMVGQ